MSADDMEIRIRLSGARAAAGEMKGLKAEVVGTGAATDKAGRKSRQAGKAFGTLRGKVGALTSSYSHAAKGILAAGAAFASYEGVKTAIEKTDGLAQSTLRLSKNQGLSVKTASEWAAVTTVRGIESGKLGQTFTLLSRQVEAATKEYQKQKTALGALGATQADQKKRHAILAAGAGKSSAAFARLGITQKQVVAGRTDVSGFLLKVADGMSKLGPGTERTAIAAQLFGRSYQPLLPLLRDGSKGLQKQLNLANKYGATFGGKSLKSVEDFIMEQRKAQFAILGFQITIATKVLPTLTKVIGAFSKFVLQVREGTGAGGKFRDKVEQIWKAAKPVVFWFGRAAKNVFTFVSKHPALVKVGVALFFVSRALRAMKFFSAISGAKRLLTWLGVIGKTKAGEAAASEITSALAGGKGKPGIVGRLKASGIGAKLRGLGHSWGVLIAPAMLLVLDNKINAWLDKNVGQGANKVFHNSSTTGKPSIAQGPAGVPTLVSPGGGGGILDTLGGLLPKRSAGASMTPAMGSPAAGVPSGVSAYGGGDVIHHTVVQIGDRPVWEAWDRHSRKKANRK